MYNKTNKNVSFNPKDLDDKDRMIKWEIQENGNMNQVWKSITEWIRWLIRYKILKDLEQEMSF